YTATWWWIAHAKLQREKKHKGHFIIPIFAYSDGVELSRYCGDKELNPVNMTVGNYDAWVRCKPSMGVVRAIALLPSRLKYTGSETSHQRTEQRIRANEVQQEVNKEAFKDIGKLYKKGIEIVCPDGKIRWGHPILASWIADYMEYTKLFSILNKTCPA
ncbi:hypothetical protein BJ508DRAFT_341943, partial [Ascobolus immersus RN42]